jgi:hypothetical protein
MLPVKKFRLPKDIPLEEYPKPEEYLNEARRLTDEAQKQGLILRVMGPIALYFYFPQYIDLYRGMERLGEKVFTDIDYASYGKNRGKIVPFFEKQGYELEKRAAMMSGGNRHIYYSDRIPMIDVFFDKLDYNHLINYKGRLEIHPYCVSLTDLLLQKLQIVKINDKDLKDAMLLLLAAQIGEDENNKINLKYVAKLMSDDWGFFYTSTMNLNKVQASVTGVPVLSDQERILINEKAEAMIKIIQNEPKSGKWKGRAKTGASKIWYKEVSDWE